MRGRWSSWMPPLTARLLLPVVMAAFSCGCETTRRVVAHWREEGEVRIPQATRVGPLIAQLVAAPKGAQGVAVRFGHPQTIEFKIEKFQQSVESVRYADAAYVERHNKEVADKLMAYPVGVVFTLGLITPAIVIEESENAAKAGTDAEAEKRYIERMRKGETTIKHGAHLTYLREARDRKVLKTFTNTGDGPFQAIAGRPVRLVSGGRQLAEATTGLDGVALLSCMDIRQAQRIRPGEVVAQIRPEETWVDAGRITLGQTEVNQLARAAQLQSMSHRGQPAGRPVAEVDWQLPASATPAGRIIPVAITIKNVGLGDFYGLMGRMKSELVVLNDLEFVFGRLGVDEEVTLTSEVFLPSDLSPGSVSVRLEFTEYNNYAPLHIDRELVIAAAPAASPSIRGRSKR